MAGEGKREEAVSEKVIRYMESRCGQPLPLRELAAQAYLSPSQLIRRFRRETGFTPHDYLNRLRIAKAGRLLRYTDKTVSEVAREVGFRQPSRFIELYRELNGVTPGRERG
jgi:transcriptional regulator, araC family